MRYLLQLAVLNAGILAASCTTGSSTADSPSPATRQLAPGAGSLLARPLRLPHVPPGVACPVTPIASVAAPISTPRGKAPFYLGGPLPQGAVPFNKMVFAIVGGEKGPVLLRGGRIDGRGKLVFSGSPADFMERGDVISSPGAGAWTFYSKILSPGPEDGFYLYPSVAGCYAIQIDAPTFQETIVLYATQGPSQS
ncbi:MAG: hypothetical protein M3077_07930 [Candidatus Dormibacteraeota bacterium]|nr:hypothetical protein [Candidatus Dormibacteraeota bacterium]